MTLSPPLPASSRGATGASAGRRPRRRSGRDEPDGARANRPRSRGARRSAAPTTSQVRSRQEASPCPSRSQISLATPAPSASGGAGAGPQAPVVGRERRAGVADHRERGAPPRSAGACRARTRGRPLAAWARAPARPRRRRTSVSSDRGPRRRAGASARCYLDVGHDRQVIGGEPGGVGRWARRTAERGARVDPDAIEREQRKRRPGRWPPRGVRPRRACSQRSGRPTANHSLMSPHTMVSARAARRRGRRAGAGPGRAARPGRSPRWVTSTRTRTPPASRSASMAARGSRR